MRGRCGPGGAPAAPRGRVHRNGEGEGCARGRAALRQAEGASKAGPREQLGAIWAPPLVRGPHSLLQAVFGAMRSSGRGQEQEGLSYSECNFSHGRAYSLEK